MAVETGGLNSAERLQSVAEVVVCFGANARSKFYSHARVGVGVPIIGERLVVGV